MALFNMQNVVKRARSSSFYLWLLNFGMSRMIPFNKPHGYKILEISERQISILLPYKKSNLNHIKGLHACSMATVAEFTTGFLLIANLDPKKYRIIMRKIEMEYFYQGKMDAFARFELKEEWLEEQIYGPIKTNGKTEVECLIDLHDKESNKLSTGKVTWQIKSWDQVRTKL